MTIYEQLKLLKEKSKMTSQQIADISKIPVSTVNRILSGYTDSPSFSNVCDMIVAMGGSVDEVIGISSLSEYEDDSGKHLKYLENMVELYQNTIMEYRKWLKRLFIVLITLLGLVEVVLLIDVMNGNFGYFKY